MLLTDSTDKKYERKFFRLKVTPDGNSNLMNKPRALVKAIYVIMKGSKSAYFFSCLLLTYLKNNCIKQCVYRGAWVAQPVKCLMSAQIMILWFVGSIPASCSVLTAQSLEHALDSVSLSLFFSPTCALSLCLKNK